MKRTIVKIYVVVKKVINDICVRLPGVVLPEMKEDDFTREVHLVHAEVIQEAHLEIHQDVPIHAEAEVLDVEALDAEVLDAEVLDAEVHQEVLLEMKEGGFTHGEAEVLDVELHQEAPLEMKEGGFTHGEHIPEAEMNGGVSLEVLQRGASKIKMHSISLVYKLD